jgi:hypothetical protein
VREDKGHQSTSPVFVDVEIALLEIRVNTPLLSRTMTSTDDVKLRRITVPWFTER